MCLYIVTGAPILFYQQGNQNSCILSSLESAFNYMGDKYASEYIIRGKKRSLLGIHNKGWMHFCRDILMRHHREKTQKRLNYRIEEWHTSTPYYIFCNQSTYPTVCLLLDIWHQTDHCIAVSSKCIFDSNLKVVISLTQNFLNYLCRGNDTDENNVFCVLHAIRTIPPEVVQRIFNMK